MPSQPEVGRRDPRIKNYVCEGDGDPRHGRPGTYVNHGCRCLTCRRGWAEYHTKWMHDNPQHMKRHLVRDKERRAEQATSLK